MESTIEYRYKTIEKYGTIRILDDAVTCDIAEGFSKWSYETPLKRIYPEPVRSWSFSSVFWISLLVGGAGLAAGISLILNPADAPDPAWITYLVLVLSLGVIAFAVYVRRQERVSFPTECDSIWIHYSRSDPDRKRFDEFTAELSSKIAKARASRLKPKVADDRDQADDEAVNREVS